MGRTALIVLAVALLVGSVAAFTRAERLKLARSPVAEASSSGTFAGLRLPARDGEPVAPAQEARALDVLIVDATADTCD